MTMPTPLNGAQRRSLKQQAHHLKPVVLLGQAGLTEAVLAEIEIALDHHELIKVRINAEDRESRDAQAQTIAERTGAGLVQRIGHVATYFRVNRARAAAVAAAALEAAPTRASAGRGRPSANPGRGAGNRGSRDPAQPAPVGLVARGGGRRAAAGRADSRGGDGGAAPARAGEPRSTPWGSQGRSAGWSAERPAAGRGPRGGGGGGASAGAGRPASRGPAGGPPGRASGPRPAGGRGRRRP